MEIITIDTKVYSLRAIFGTAYVFLDNYYIFLDNFEDGKIQVKIKSKKENEDLEKIIDEFKNELINASLRLKISEENKKIREIIVTSALYGRVEAPRINDPKGICKTWEESHSQVKINDPKGICKTWEEINSNDNVHKAVNNEILKEKNSEYCKMFKCDGDKN
ncbi:MAG: His-Xaa-Ser system protein HxsD [Candidatus Pacebacteria bacterium]|nr:His-Xaa-Ser system protein HxsD [Candidatus Paceibacterota bacterium]